MRIDNNFVKGLAIAGLLMPLAFGNTRSWVSSTGSDANACTRSAPCATFQGALANTDSGGEIDVVDPGDYGSVYITQSVAIDGGGMGRILASGLAAVVIKSGAVSILNLSIVGTIFTSGILALPGSGFLSIHNVHISGVGEAVGVAGTGATITDSVIEGSTQGVACGSGTCIIRNTSLLNNTGTGVLAQTTQPLAATAVVDSCLISGSSIGVQAGYKGFAGTVQLTNTTVTANNTGLVTDGSSASSMISFVNNRVYGNGTDGAPTKSVFQK